MKQTFRVSSGYAIWIFRIGGDFDLPRGNSLEMTKKRKNENPETTPLTRKKNSDRLALSAIMDFSKFRRHKTRLPNVKLVLAWKNSNCTR